MSSRSQVFPILSPDCTLLGALEAKQDLGKVFSSLDSFSFIDIGTPSIFYIFPYNFEAIVSFLPGVHGFLPRLQLYFYHQFSLSNLESSSICHSVGMFSACSTSICLTPELSPIQSWGCKWKEGGKSSGCTRSMTFYSFLFIALGQKFGRHTVALVL